MSLPPIDPGALSPAERGRMVRLRRQRMSQTVERAIINADIALGLCEKWPAPAPPEVEGIAAALRIALRSAREARGRIKAEWATAEAEK